MCTARAHQVSALVCIINDIISPVLSDMLHFMGVYRYFGTQEHPFIKLISSDGILAGSDRKLYPEQMKINPVKPVQGMGITFGL